MDNYCTVSALQYFAEEPLKQLENILSLKEPRHENIRQIEKVR